MTGLELQRVLSARGYARPIVFVTARGDVPMTVQGMRAGAISFLPKPVRKAEALATVSEAISKDSAAELKLAEQRRVLQLLKAPHAARATGDGPGHHGHEEQADRRPTFCHREDRQSPPRPAHWKKCRSSLRLRSRIC